eukprot:GHVL01004957.1.p2 GENE.GHVL01004957.1~~GHVL01004957.1.p2  ORF type:complete len:110 (+),score=1.09 GHVL01004957.1:81-410(+)
MQQNCTVHVIVFNINEIMIRSWKSHAVYKKTEMMSSLLKPHVPTRNLRSADAGHLVVPRIKLNAFGKRAFIYTAPSIWNSLPMSVRLSTSLLSFKSSLKTHLFRQYFDA